MLFEGLNIPTNYDADVEVRLSPDTMVFLGALALLFIAAKKRKIL